MPADLERVVEGLIKAGYVSPVADLDAEDALNSRCRFSHGLDGDA
jgi:hypothetical protein